MARPNTRPDLPLPFEALLGAHQAHVRGAHPEAALGIRLNDFFTQLEHVSPHVLGLRVMLDLEAYATLVPDARWALDAGYIKVRAVMSRVFTGLWGRGGPSDRLVVFCGGVGDFGIGLLTSAVLIKALGEHVEYGGDLCGNTWLHVLLARVAYGCTHVVGGGVAGTRGWMVPFLTVSAPELVVALSTRCSVQGLLFRPNCGGLTPMQLLCSFRSHPERAPAFADVARMTAVIMGEVCGGRAVGAPPPGLGGVPDVRNAQKGGAEPMEGGGTSQELSFGEAFGGKPSKQQGSVDAVGWSGWGRSGGQGQDTGMEVD